MKVPISKIKVENRARKDMGDIDGLAQSIKLIGLLQPILIDEDFNLIAGQRRLEAIKSLGKTEVECIMWQPNLEEFNNDNRKQTLIKFIENNS